MDAIRDIFALIGVCFCLLLIYGLLTGFGVGDFKNLECNGQPVVIDAVNITRSGKEYTINSGHEDRALVYIQPEGTICMLKE